MVLVTNRTKKKRFYFVYPHISDPDRLFIRSSRRISLTREKADKLIERQGGVEAVRLRCIPFAGTLQEFMAMDPQKRNLDYEASNKRWMDYLKSIPEPNENQAWLIIQAMLSEQRREVSK